PRQKDARADDRSVAPEVVDQERGDDPQRRLEDLREEDELDREEQRAPVVRVSEQVGVVLEANPRPNRHARTDGLGEADVEALKKRPPDQGEEEQRGGGKEQPRGDPIRPKGAAETSLETTTGNGGSNDPCLRGHGYHLKRCRVSGVGCRGRTGPPPTPDT